MTNHPVDDSCHPPNPSLSMTSPSATQKSSVHSELQVAVEHDFLLSLLKEEVFYTHLAAAAPDPEFAVDDSLSGDEFFSVLERIWGRLDQRQTLLSHLAAQFHSLPQEIMTAIVHQAEQVMARQWLDRLVACVQAALPEWSSEDLQVLGRPLACAMRGGEVAARESLLRTVRPLDWSELSDLEKARLALAAADAVLRELQA